MGYIIGGFFIFLVLIIAYETYRAKYGAGRKVKVEFRDSETGRTIHVGVGTSIGSAIADGFSKMCDNVSVTSREETIRIRLDSMSKTLEDNRSRMFKSDIESCEQYIGKMRELLSQKEAERQQEQQQRQEAIQEKQRLKQEKADEKARQRKAKDEKLAQRKRYIAEQRRMMTASLRYDVMRRDNFRCTLCGAVAGNGVTLHVDHIVPLAKGGKTEMSNLRTLCDRCNIGKGAKIETPEADSQQLHGKDYASVGAFLSVLRKNGIPCVDKRKYGGCLWVVSMQKTDDFMSETTIAGKHFLRAKATSNFNGKPGWYIK